MKFDVGDSAVAKTLKLGVCMVGKGGVRWLCDGATSPQAAYLAKDEGFGQGLLLGLGVLRDG